MVSQRPRKTPRQDVHPACLLAGYDLRDNSHAPRGLVVILSAAKNLLLSAYRGCFTSRFFAALRMTRLSVFGRLSMFFLCHPFFRGVVLIELEFLNFTRQGIASPAEQCGRFDAPPAGVL